MCIIVCFSQLLHFSICRKLIIKDSLRLFLGCSKEVGRIQRPGRFIFWRNGLSSRLCVCLLDLVFLEFCFSSLRPRSSCIRTFRLETTFRILCRWSFLHLRILHSSASLISRYRNHEHYRSRNSRLFSGGRPTIFFLQLHSECREWWRWGWLHRRSHRIFHWFCRLFICYFLDHRRPVHWLGSFCHRQQRCHRRMNSRSSHT